jgi:Raf kinase inhibitor-like YbhB/YbcL family protein
MKQMENSPEVTAIKVSSTAFARGEMIPSQYTCEGINISPALDIFNIPESTKSLALVVEDPDAPSGTWVHWVVWNITVTQHLRENQVPGTEGLNDFLKHHYSGPCPPSGKHRYFFKIYAVNTLLNLPAHTSKVQLEKAMNDHIVGYGELMGWYKKKY